MDNPKAMAFLENGTGIMEGRQFMDDWRAFQPPPSFTVPGKPAFNPPPGLPTPSHITARTAPGLLHFELLTHFSPIDWMFGFGVWPGWGNGESGGCDRWMRCACCGTRESRLRWGAVILTAAPGTTPPQHNQDSRVPGPSADGHTRSGNSVEKLKLIFIRGDLEAEENPPPTPPSARE